MAITKNFGESESSWKSLFEFSPLLIFVLLLLILLFQFFRSLEIKVFEFVRYFVHSLEFFLSKSVGPYYRPFYRRSMPSLQYFALF